MKDFKKALRWIVCILEKHNIKFQILGGFAAYAYGSIRDLVDIDLVIPENDFEKILPDVKGYVVEGPRRSKSESWDCYYMEIIYENVTIEIGGADSSKIFDKARNKWVNFEIDLSKSVKKKVLKTDIFVIPKAQLIAYKKKLGREVDRIDIKQLS